MKQYNRTLCGTVVAAGMLLSLAVQADNMSFYGTLVEQAPCTINNNQQIIVAFGNDLLTSKIDGVNYVKAVDYSLECKGNSNNSMKLKVQGTGTTFNSSALQTNMSDLGIALRAGGIALTLNSWINFNYPDKPLLHAVPVKRAGATLSGGDFSAAATLMVDYQ